MERAKSSTRNCGAKDVTRGTEVRVVMEWVLSRPANPPLFPCLGEEALGEVETLLRFGQLALEVLHTMLNCFEPLRHVGRWYLRTTGPETRDLEDRQRGNPYEDQERGKKNGWFHVAFLGIGIGYRRGWPKNRTYPSEALMPKLRKP